LPVESLGVSVERGSGWLVVRRGVRRRRVWRVRGWNFMMMGCCSERKEWLRVA
jgi:uncharacterized alpha-E superfamily protein